MKKYIFYVRLLLKLVIRLDFSTTAIKQFCIETIKKRPDDYHARFLLAGLYRSEDKNAEAIVEYSKLTNMGFMNEKILYGLAVATFRGRMYDQALRYFNELLKMMPGNKMAIDHIARIHLVNGDYSEAITYFEKSLSLDSRSALVLENIAYCYYNIGEYRKSYDAYAKAFELNPNPKLREDLNLAKSKVR